MKRALVLTALSCVVVGASVPLAQAASSVRYVDYANCTSMNRVYPHGVGRQGAHDHVSGSSKPVTNFYRNTRLYKINVSHDRDHDGIACEKD